MFDDQVKDDKPQVEDMLASADPVTPKKSDAQSDAPSVPTNLPIAPSASSEALNKETGPIVDKVTDPIVTNVDNSKPVPQPPTGTQEPSRGVIPPSPPRSEASNILKVIIIVFISIFVIVMAGYLAYRLMTQEVVTDEVIDNAPIEEVNEGDDDGPEPLDEEEEIEDIDTDGDGLTDAEEIEAGTDLENVDTDQDGLGDREEIKVYGTDPFDSDTDDDGFLDGQEVAAGYNPNGEGKLFDIPK